jgi:hypothetical protein
VSSALGLNGSLALPAIRPVKTPHTHRQLFPETPRTGRPPIATACKSTAHKYNFVYLQITGPKVSDTYVVALALVRVVSIASCVHEPRTVDLVVLLSVCLSCIGHPNACGSTRYTEKKEVSVRLGRNMELLDSHRIAQDNQSNSLAWVCG